MSADRFPHSKKEDRFEFHPEARAELERIIRKYPVKRSALIPALWLAQKQNGFITSAVMQHIAGIFEISAMEVWGVVSFYTMLKTGPIGEFHVQICNNLSCALMGAGSLLKHLEKRLGVKAGETRAGTGSSPSRRWNASAPVAARPACKSTRIISNA